MKAWAHRLLRAQDRIEERIEVEPVAVMRFECDGPDADHFLCKRVCCDPDAAYTDDLDDYLGLEFWDDYESQPRWARSAVLDENGMNLA